MKTHIFGIRHHGPGSARSLCQALADLQPDIILVEGSPDAEMVLPLLAHSQMRPPVALLVYVPDQPQQAVYYPFAVFSPEWQAIRYGLQQQIPVWLMDLPQAHRFAVEREEQEQRKGEREGEEGGEGRGGGEGREGRGDGEGEEGRGVTASSSPPSPPSLPSPPPLEADWHDDPLSLLAQAAGYSDGERWWEHLVEQRQDSTALFAAILEAMTVLRAEVESSSQPLTPNPQPLLEAQREAYMRRTIREAEKQGFQKIAVVCGAWHAPALVKMPPAKEDMALLKGLPKVKVEATWIPWTYGRLSMSSGYGAGVESPGWYQHLWEMNQESGVRGQGSGVRDQDEEGGEDGEDEEATASSSSPLATPYPLLPNSYTSIRWMTKVARLLRQRDLDASSASVIEAVRLAEALAALRDRPLPGLAELNEATQTVLCFGDPLPMQLIHQQLIVGERLGRVPDELPMVPLQQDLQRQQKRLRLKLEATESSLELDLRKPLDLERSQLLHRLMLLNVPWGKPQSVGNAKGTFRESWRLQWQPEFAIRLIEAGIWGNTVETATTTWTCDRADKANLADLTKLIDQTLLANLPQAIAYLMNRLQAEAAIASDISHLMAALPPLVNVLRYGTVRQFETEVVGHVIDGLIARICIGLPVACASLDDDAAADLYQLLIAVHSAIGLLQQADALEMWQQTLTKMADQQGLHGLLAGRSCRLLFEAGVFQTEDTARRLGLALSTAIEPTQAAAWIEGFLAGSGLLLLHNPALWQVLDHWVMQLPADSFTAILPLLRRTFATFSAPERRQMGEQVRRGGDQGTGISDREHLGEWDGDRADAILPLLAQLLGVSIHR